MPSWLLSILISIVTKLGIPALMKRFPGLPGEIWTLITDILSHIGSSPTPTKAVADLKAKVKECTGAACPADTVKG